MNNQTEYHPAVEGCRVAIQRCLSLLDQVTDEQLAAKPRGPGSIGAHLRHCIDHFTCFFEGRQRGVVDYDARERDEKLEQNLSHARRALESIHEELGQLPEDDLRAPLAVTQTPSEFGDPISAESSLERELLFLSGHTIHHIAMLKVLAEDLGVSTPKDFDLAYSTARYRDGSRKQTIES